MTHEEIGEWKYSSTHSILAH